MTNPEWEDTIEVNEPGFCSTCGGQVEFDECECMTDEVEYDDMTDGHED